MTRIILIYLCSISFAFAQDSLVRFNELNYASEIERNAFKSLTSPEPDYLAFLLATDPHITADKVNNTRTRTKGTADQLTALGIKKPDKRVKTIYERVHADYLRKFEFTANFYEIFDNGNYNCVTSSALYCVVLDYMKIPYAIKEEPTHVFVVAYPDNGNIMMQTTSPLYGYMAFDNGYKQDFITNLKKQKIIGDTEAERTDLEVLFNKYYFQDQSIDLRKLVGLHFFNSALFKNDARNYKEAFNQAEKAYVLYPAQRCQYLLAYTGARLLAKGGLKPLEKATLIGKLSRYQDQGITNDMISGEFINMTQDILAKQNNRTLYTQCYKELMNRVDNTELKSELDYIYNYEYARSYYNQGNFVAAKLYFGRALVLQPNNVDLNALFIMSLGQSFKNLRESKPALDTLLAYDKKFPSLHENNNFNTMLAGTYVMQFGSEYDDNHPAQGDEYRKKFEDMVTADPNIDVSDNIIGDGYSKACIYYFKKGQKSKAREIVKKGLVFAPNSFELRARQQMMGQ